MPTLDYHADDIVPAATARHFSGSTMMAGFGARAAAGLALPCPWPQLPPPSAPRVAPAGVTDWPSSNYDQTANRYSPLDQITAQQRRHARSRPGAFISSPPATPAALREDEAIPLVIGNTMYLALAVRRHPRAGRDDRRGEVEVPASQQRPAVEARPRVLAGRRRRRPPSIIFGGLAGRALLDQGVGRHAQRPASARTASST